MTHMTHIPLLILGQFWRKHDPPPRNAPTWSVSVASCASCASWVADMIDPTGDTVTAQYSEAADVLHMLGWHRPDWQASARCRDYPHLPWFIERGQSATPALECCALCPVMAACLSWAMNDSALDAAGVLGGLTANARRQRRKLDQQRKAVQS